MPHSARSRFSTLSSRTKHLSVATSTLLVASSTLCPTCLLDRFLDPLDLFADQALGDAVTRRPRPSSRTTRSDSCSRTRRATRSTSSSVIAGAAARGATRHGRDRPTRSRLLGGEDARQTRRQAPATRVGLRDRDDRFPGRDRRAQRDRLDERGRRGAGRRFGRRRTRLRRGHRLGYSRRLRRGDDRLEAIGHDCEARAAWTCRTQVRAVGKLQPGRQGGRRDDGRNDSDESNPVGSLAGVGPNQSSPAGTRLLGHGRSDVDRFDQRRAREPGKRRIELIEIVVELRRASFEGSRGDDRGRRHSSSQAQTRTIGQPEQASARPPAAGRASSSLHRRDDDLRLERLRQHAVAPDRVAFA